MRIEKTQSSQNGAALVLGLVILIAVTVLATASARTASSGLQLARYHQTHELLFQAAETGIEHVLAASSFDAARPVVLMKKIDAHTSVTTQLKYAGETDLPDDAFDFGAAHVVAYHFVVKTVATIRHKAGTDSSRDVRTVHTQSFYIVGPAASGSPPPVIRVLESPTQRVCVGADCLDLGVAPALTRTTWHTGDSE